jgi:hypothetical protein
VSYAQKSVRAKQAVVPVDEEIGLRDMRAARALWAKYAPQRYAELTR